MKYLSIYPISKIAPSFLLIFCLLSNALNAQYASFGSGLGGNIIRSDDHSAWRSINTKTTSSAYSFIGQPRLSLNIDYNFPREIAEKGLGKLYNPIFSNAHTQLRGQVIFNQFNVSEQKNTSIATFGASFLYFPVKIDENKKTNFFIEAGYKMGWNNTVVDPFNSFVMGIGTRHRLGNEWYWQTNLSFTWAFYDYLDQTGPKGYAKTSKDGFALLNFTLLKPFLTNKEQKRMEQSRDSLAVAENFAANVVQKSTKASESIKALQNDLKLIEDKIKGYENNLLKISELSNNVTKNVNQGYAHLKTKDEVLKTEREIDSLQSFTNNTGLTLAFDLEKVQFELINRNPLDAKIIELQQEINDTRQNLLLANKFLPRSKDFNFRVQQLEATTLGTAKSSLDKVLKEWQLAQNKLDKNKTRLKNIMLNFEKTAKQLKNANQELEKILLVIEKAKSNG
jgi:hypothetical protein